MHEFHTVGMNMKSNTIEIMTTHGHFEEITKEAKYLFVEKGKDYGTSWRILRLPSITDQIYIKVARIRAIQIAGKQKVKDPIRDEFIGIINYSLMALMQINFIDQKINILDMELDGVNMLYDTVVSDIRVLLADKNHDYGEAWRDMRIPSIVDIMLMKLIRIKQIEDNFGETLVSEGVDAGYKDLVNYAVFALILMSEQPSNGISETGGVTDLEN